MTTLSVGDQVVLSWLPNCGRCRRCLEGRLSLCEVAVRDMAGPCRVAARGYHGPDAPSTTTRTCPRSRGTPSSRPVPASCFRPEPISRSPRSSDARDDRYRCGLVNRAKVTPGSSVAVFGGRGRPLRRHAALASPAQRRSSASSPSRARGRWRSSGRDRGARRARPRSARGTAGTLRRGIGLRLRGGRVDEADRAGVAATRPGGMIVTVGNRR